MIGQNREKDVIQEFRNRRNRQLAAIAISVFLLIALLWRHSHPGLIFGELSKTAVTIGEIAIIAGFIIFSATNWRCPACGRYLGRDINLRRCRKCRAVLARD